MPLDYPNCITVEFVQQLFGKPLLNILKFQLAEPFTVSDLGLFGDDLVSWWGTEMAPIFSQDLSLEVLVLTSIDLSNPIMYVTTTGTPVNGEVVQESEPVNVAALTRLFTGYIGSARKGRVYSSGIPVTEVQGNALGDTFKDGLQAAYNALITTLALGGWTWVVASGMNEPGPGTGLTSPVLACYTDDNVHDMGRRLNNV